MGNNSKKKKRELDAIQSQLSGSRDTQYDVDIYAEYDLIGGIILKPKQRD